METRIVGDAPAETHATAQSAQLDKTAHEVAAHSKRSKGRKAGTPGKIGRNDPCFCGSGKKYKHCHGSPTGVGV
jgi:preprotein translocase subunit SecA